MKHWYSSPTLVVNLSRKLGKHLGQQVLVIAYPEHPNTLFVFSGFNGHIEDTTEFTLTVVNGRVKVPATSPVPTALLLKLVAFCRSFNGVTSNV